MSLLNIQRLTHGTPTAGWNIVTAHLLLVQHIIAAPAAVRLQAAEVLDSLLLVAPRNITPGTDELARRVQHQVLLALASQAEPAARVQSSIDIEIRRLALDTLFKILETNGHSFSAGWIQIFDILRTACPSPLANIQSPATPYSAQFTADPMEVIEEESRALAREKSAKSPVLVRTSFPSLQLICTDFLEALVGEELRVCISTLAEFGRQADDINVALTVRHTSRNLVSHH